MWSKGKVVRQFILGPAGELKRYVCMYTETIVSTVIAAVYQCCEQLLFSMQSVP